mmetsp:Transcript_6675/g.15883  ORF Transcript_6675/g.15883 Transcript_6675/m.15883 type:complete len:436 (-) Transcript_6675:264-1571(-)
MTRGPSTPTASANAMASASLTSPAPMFDLPSPSFSSPSGGGRSESVAVHVQNMAKIHRMVNDKQTSWATLDDGLQREFTSACAALKVAADLQNDAKAQCALGEMNSFGRGVPVDEACAYKYWKKAALQGHAQSQFYVAIAHRDGKGLPAPTPSTDSGLEMLSFFGCGGSKTFEDEPSQSLEVALHWFELAGQQNHTGALIAAGDAYYHGHGTFQSSESAVHFYKRAIESAGPNYTKAVMKASVNLATLYRSGDGAPRSLAKALTLYEEAAESRFVHTESKRAAKQIRKEVARVCPLLFKRVEVVVPNNGVGKSGADKTTLGLVSIEGQRGTVVDFDENSMRYVVEFDILEPGQTAKLSTNNLDVVIDDSEDKENAVGKPNKGAKANSSKDRSHSLAGRGLNPRSRVKALSLAQAPEEGISSPAQKEAVRRARFGV